MSGTVDIISQKPVERSIVSMRVPGVVVLMFATFVFAGCGDAVEDVTEPVVGTDGSPTLVNEATATTPAATATSAEPSASNPADATPERMIASRYFLRAEGEAGQPPSAEDVQAASDVVKQRLEAFLETGVRISPDPKYPDLIVADIVTSGLSDAEMATVLGLMTETGLMEIIDTQGSLLELGTVVSTTLGSSDGGGPTYETIVSGRDVSRAYVTSAQFGNEVVGFELGDEGAARFEAHTGANIGQPMSIVVDKRVVNSATILDEISSHGAISGLTGDDAVKLAIQLDSDPLPVALSLIDDPAG
jgi:hypothetical protein